MSPQWSVEDQTSSFLLLMRGSAIYKFLGVLTIFSVTNSLHAATPAVAASGRLSQFSPTRSQESSGLITQGASVSESDSARSFIAGAGGSSVIAKTTAKGSGISYPSAGASITGAIRIKNPSALASLRTPGQQNLVLYLPVGAFCTLSTHTIPGGINQAVSSVNFSASAGGSRVSGSARIENGPFDHGYSNDGAFEGLPESGGSANALLEIAVSTSGSAMAEITFSVSAGASTMDLSSKTEAQSTIVASIGTSLRNAAGEPIDMDEYGIEVLPFAPIGWGLPSSFDELWRHWADPVDTASGSYVAKRSFLSQNCPTALAFTMEYDSSWSGDGPLGTGWSHNYQIELVTQPDGYSMILMWNQNRRSLFSRSSVANSYISTDRAVRNAVLTKNVNGSFTLLKRDQSRLEFDSSGKLIAIHNAKGQAITLAYDAATGRQTSATDSISGKSLNFSYLANGRINRVTDPLGRRLDFSYNASGHLTNWSLSAANGPPVASVIFTTDAAGRILTATDLEGITYVTNAYDSSGRVTTQDDGIPSSPLTYFFYEESEDGSLHSRRIVDRNGKTAYFKYDRNFQLTSFTNQNGETTNYHYDGKENLLSIKDGLNRTESFTYDLRGNPITATDPTGAVMSMTYDERNNVTSVINVAGKQTTLRFNSANCLKTITNALNQTTTFEYDHNNQLKQCTSARNAVTKLTLTSGVLTSIQDANGNTINLGHDASGRLISSTDAAGKITAFAYDANDNLLSVTDPLNHATTFTYDSRRRRLTATNALNQTTSFTYNGNGKIKRATDPLGHYVDLAYDHEDRLITSTDQRGNPTSLAYDDAGNLTSITDPLGRAQRFRFNEAGEQVELIDAGGGSYRTAFDPRGLPLSVEDPHYRKDISTFDNIGRLRGTANALGELTTLNYDDLDRLVSVADPLNQTSSQSFDADGNQATLVNPSGGLTSFVHDLAGLLTSVTVPGNRTTSYRYDARKLLDQVTEPSGQQTNITYDDAGRPVSCIDPVGTRTLTYDKANRPLTITEGNATITRIFDGNGRLKQFTDADGNILKYTYDEAGNLTTLTYPDGKAVNYAYNASNQMTSVTDWAGRITAYAYGADGRLSSVAKPDGSVESRTWFPTGEVATIQNRKDTVTITDYSIIYDVAGRIVDENPNPLPGPYAPAPFTATYDLGNRLSTFNSMPVAFDADGNMIEGPQISGAALATFTYDARNRLTGFEGVTYTYDAENRRVGHTDGTGTHRYVVNPNTPLSQVLVRTRPDGTVTRAVYGLGLLYEETGDAIRVYHYDYRGSTVAFTDATGVITGRVEYGPYGELARRTGDTATPFLFNGGYGVMTDANGLYHMRARYYHPGIRRFINQDVLLGSIALGVSLNRFTYANGDPISLVDPFGFAAESDEGSWWDSAGEGLLWASSTFIDFGASIVTAPVYLGINIVGLGIGFDPLTGRPLDRAAAASDVAIEALLTFAPIPGIRGLSSMWRKLAANTEKMGLGNPFRDKTATEIDKMFRAKGFEPRGPDPLNGKGGYLNTKNQRSYHIDEANSFGETPHVDVNRLKKYKGPLEKKKYEMGGAPKL